MQFSTFIKHSARLLRIIWNSPQPADSLTSEFLHGKRNATRDEKKAISEIVFTTLRLYRAIEYCANQAFSSLQKSDYNPHKQKKKKNKELTFEKGLITTACLLGIEENIISQEIFSPFFPKKDETWNVEISKALGFSEADGQKWISNTIQTWHDLKTTAIQQLQTETVELNLLSTYAGIQPWILETWRHHYDSWQTAVEMAISLWQSASLCLRVNLMQNSRTEIKQHLADKGIASEDGKLSPACLILSERINLREGELYQQGNIEIQDEASQLLAYAVAPEPHWRILDACAGAGGKSLHLATLQHDQGEIIASDIEYNRLKEIPFRANRAGLSSITTVVLSPQEIKTDELPDKLSSLWQKCDAVVVDAPCSALGTVRRIPTPKWRLTPKLVQRLAAKQLSILQAYSNAVKPSGILVYATCSLMPQENEGIINQFLLQYPEFQPDPLYPVFAQQGILIDGLTEDNFMLTLSPATHNTDGFFMARLRRNGRGRSRSVGTR